MLTDEQKKIRNGKFCASENFKIAKPKGIGDGGQTYIWDLIAERETGKSKDVPEVYAMKWGNDHEPEAAAYYEQCKDIKLIKGESMPLCEVVATPDYTYEDTKEPYGIEIKCPSNSSNHSRRLRYIDYKCIKKNNADYYWQMVTGMIVTGFKKWVFLSYDPRFTDPSKKMVAITVPFVKNDVEFLIGRINESIDFMEKHGIKNLDKLKLLEAE